MLVHEKIEIIFSINNNILGALFQRLLRILPVKARLGNAEEKEPARMRTIRMRTCVVFVLAMLIASGCAKEKYDNGYEGINFDHVAEFSDSRGQVKIKLVVYSGEPEKENIKAYAGTLGCGMLYAYFYPDSIMREEIPIAEITSATSFVQAQEILFKEEGYSRWHYAAQCLAMIPTVTDCQETPLSPNCR